MSNGLFDTLKKSTENLVHSVADATHTAADTLDPHKIKDFANRKIAIAVHGFSKALPLFEEAGFKLRSFDVTLGISPTLTPRFIITKDLDPEERHAMLARAEEFGGSVKAVLIALFKAVDLRHHMTLGALELVGLNVSISAIPSVRLVFE
jgi:hypothetical protein